MSVLEDRMRRIARDEFTGMFANPEAAGAEAGADVDPLAELRDQLAALTARVDDLEKAAPRATAAKRPSRKATTEPAPEPSAESTE